MDKQELFRTLSADLENKIQFLDDKPEETISSTIHALWHKAAGISLSAEKAIDKPLPELGDEQINILQQLIQKRIDNTPLSYITERQSFMGFDLLSDKRALIPRKETELLGNKALELSKKLTAQNKQINVMDVCCGAGNVGISLAYYNSNCHVFSSDISQEAVDLTKDNIEFLQLADSVHAKQSDMMKAFEKDEYYKRFDLITCNPPYIFSSNVPKMNEEISQNEPSVAFDGGMLGIKIIQTLISEAPKYIKDGGWVAFEIGAGQGSLLTKLIERTNQFKNIETVLNAAGQIRVIAAQKFSNK